MATPKKTTTKNTKKTTAKNPKKSQAKVTKGNSKAPAGLLSGINKLKLSRQAAKKYARPLAIVVVAAALVLTWYFKFYTNTENIFWDMIDNNLSTKGFSKISDQQGGSISSREITQVIFRPEIGVKNFREITDNTQQQPTKIKLEAIGTTNSDYQRYMLIDRPAQPGKDKLDYGKVYGMWLKNEGQQAQLLSNNLFGPVLLGDLPASAKGPIIDELRKAYKVDFAKVQKINLDGRRTYLFDTEVSLVHYATAAKKYARALGLPIADQIDPSGYSADDKTTVTIYVDALSRHVRRLHYKSGNTFETYTAYGISKDLGVPAKTVSSDEFQDTINSVSKD